MIDINNKKVPAIKVNELTKSYDNQTLALNKVSFEINQGEIVGLLGPNGAGKTTTLNIMAGCLSYDFGEVKLNGYDLAKYPSKAKQNLGYLPEQPPIYLNLTIAEYLNYVCGLKKIKDKQKEISRVCALCKIGANLNALIKHLSKGYRQRVGIAQALLGNPRVIILDEPTSGLDPGQIVEIRDLIKTLSKSQTIVLSTQILAEIHNLCNKIIILCGGEVIANGSEQEIINKSTFKTVKNLKVKANKTQILNALAPLKDQISVELCEQENDEISFKVTPLTNKDIRLEISKLLTESNLFILEFSDNKKSLESVFLELTVKRAESRLKQPINTVKKRKTTQKEVKK